MLAKAISLAIDSSLRRNLFNLKGRASRFEYFCATCINSLVSVAFIYGFFYISFPLYYANGIDYSLITILVFCVLAFPFQFSQFAITIRRMHDINFPSLLGIVAWSPFICVSFIGLNYYTNTFYIPHSLVAMTITMFICMSSFAVVQIILLVVPSAPPNDHGNFPEPMFPKDFYIISKYLDFGKQDNSVLALFKALHCKQIEIESTSDQDTEVDTVDNKDYDKYKNSKYHDFAYYCPVPNPPENYQPIYKYVCQKRTEEKVFQELQNQFISIWEEINHNNAYSTLMQNSMLNTHDNIQFKKNNMYSIRIKESTNKSNLKNPFSLKII